MWGMYHQHQPLTNQRQPKPNTHHPQQLEYRFRLLDAPAGDYALQATDVATGMAGQSPVFMLSAQRRRRRLYGPVMEV